MTVFLRTTIAAGILALGLVSAAHAVCPVEAGRSAVAQTVQSVLAPHVLGLIVIGARHSAHRAAPIGAVAAAR